MSDTITKKALVDTIAERTGQKRTEVKRTLQELLDQIIDELGEGNRIEFRDFGVFEVKERAARVAQNPRTLERVEVPSKRTVKFKPGRRMKQVMDEPQTGAPREAVAAGTPRADVIGSIEPKDGEVHVTQGGGLETHAQAMSPAGMTEE